jgi:hypothetical protein
MEGFIDISIESGIISEINLMSNRGIQVMNPRRCRLNFYRDIDKTKPLFCMREGLYVQIYQNINIAGIFYVEAIGLSLGETSTITINLM